MEIDLIDDIIESLLFVSGEGISINEIVELLELQKSEVNNSVNRLKEKYSGKCGIHLLSFNGKIQFGSNPAYSDIIACVLNPIKEKELSSAALETIAIIAYKQPVTRLEIEQIRGVNCDYAIQVLLKHNLIEVVGRKDVVGKPLLFGTTESFLKRFQIEDVSQLPDYEKLLESIKVLEDKVKAPAKEVSMYNEFVIPDEEKDEEVAPSETLGDAEILTNAENAGNSENSANKEVAATGGAKVKKSGKKDVEQDGKDEFGEEQIPDFLKNEKELQKIE